MAYWQDLVNSPRGYSPWIEIAWSTMQGIMFRDVAETEIPVSPERDGRFRRTYWSCFMIDRVRSVASRTSSTTVPIEQAFLEDLDISDFNIHPLQREHLATLDLSPEFGTVEYQTRIAQCHIYAVKTFFSLRNSSFNMNHLNGLGEPVSTELYMALDKQAKTLSTYSEPFGLVSGSTPEIFNHAEDVYILRSSILVIIFHSTAFCLLSQMMILQGNMLNRPNISMDRDDLHERRSTTAGFITTEFLQLQRYGLLMSIPPCIMSLILPATVMEFSKTFSPSTGSLNSVDRNYLTQSLHLFTCMSQVTLCAERWENKLNIILNEQAKQNSLVLDSHGMGEQIIIAWSK